VFSTLGLSDSSTIDSFFSSTTNSLDQFDSIANSALSRGMDAYAKKNYTGAVKEFKSSIALSPSNANAVSAYDYLAKAYLQLGKTADAIKTYQTATKAFPTNDPLHLSLGDIYYKNGEAQKAQAEYEKAVQLNPTSPDNRYSLGQSYLNNNRLIDAQAQFKRVTQFAPTSPTGYYGLGQALRASGDYKDAEVQLKKAVSINKKFANAYLELGSVYADMGDIDNAQKQLEALQGLKASQQVTSLRNYMAQAAAPKIIMAYSTNGFKSYNGPGTPLSDLDETLSTPLAEKDFNMNFVFSKAMDTGSVQNVDHWQIGRQSGNYISNDYNFGMPIPSTEIMPPMEPIHVSYDSKTNTATVTFRVSQNLAGNGTIDPSHISFKFNGIDTYKKAMDPTADEYSGFSRIV
jgi:tetratricopeptide (TPR) repeat protein